MIKIIDGDIFSSNAKFIAHQVNCQGKMGSGVALQVRRKFPHVFEEYKKICSSDMLGQIQIVNCNEDYVAIDCGSLFIPQDKKQCVCNMFSQDNYGYCGKQYTSIQALKQCFNSLKLKTMEKNANFNATIAMPYKIGCVRGGADWGEVYKIIEDVFTGCNVELWRLDNG